MSRITQNSTSIQIYTTVHCDIYHANTYTPPELHSDFINALMALLVEYDQSEYVTFHDRAGTNALTKINLGARFVMMSIISSQNNERYSSDDVSILLAIPASIFGI